MGYFRNLMMSATKPDKIYYAYSGSDFHLTSGLFNISDYDKVSIEMQFVFPYRTSGTSIGRFWQFRNVSNLVTSAYTGQNNYTHYLLSNNWSWNTYNFSLSTEPYTAYIMNWIFNNSTNNYQCRITQKDKNTSYANRSITISDLVTKMVVGGKGIYLGCDLPTDTGGTQTYFYRNSIKIMGTLGDTEMSLFDGAKNTNYYTNMDEVQMCELTLNISTAYTLSLVVVNDGTRDISYMVSRFTNQQGIYSRTLVMPQGYTVTVKTTNNNSDTSTTNVLLSANKQTLNINADVSVT